MLVCSVIGLDCESDICFWSLDKVRLVVCWRLTAMRVLSELWIVDVCEDQLAIALLENPQEAAEEMESRCLHLWSSNYISVCSR